MKKIIDGALYNTETAKELGLWNNDLGSSDFKNCTEALYRTKSGKYFLYGYGGPMSRYAESCGNNAWSGGEHIEPMSLEAAREWAEKQLSADKYMELFGPVDEAADDGREPLNITVTPAMKAALERKRSETGMSISRIIELAILGSNAAEADEA